MLFDTEYRKLVEYICEKGEMVEGKVRTVYADGTPAYYKQVVGYQFRLDNSGEEAFLITSRKAAWKSSIRELYWIWYLQSNDVDTLVNMGCKFWNEWKQEDGTIGKAYGYQIAKKTFQYKSQLDYIIGEIKNNPNSRRILTEIWVPEELQEMALTPCVHLTQWTVLNGKLYLEVRQRSCDVALGLVANVFQYQVLHKLIARECQLECGDLIWTIHNAHIYDRHLEDLQKQVQLVGQEKPMLHLGDEGLENFYEKVKVENYQPLENSFKYEVAI